MPYWKCGICFCCRPGEEQELSNVPARCLGGVEYLVMQCRGVLPASKLRPERSARLASVVSVRPKLRSSNHVISIHLIFAARSRKCLKSLALHDSKATQYRTSGPIIERIGPSLAPASRFTCGEGDSHDIFRSRIPLPRRPGASTKTTIQTPPKQSLALVTLYLSSNGLMERFLRP